MIKWLKNLFHKKEEPRLVSFAWGDISGIICYDMDSEPNKRNYYNVRDKNGRFTKTKKKGEK